MTCKYCEGTLLKERISDLKKMSFNFPTSALIDVLKELEERVSALEFRSLPRVLRDPFPPVTAPPYVSPCPPYVPSSPYPTSPTNIPAYIPPGGIVICNAPSSPDATGTSVEEPTGVSLHGELDPPRRSYSLNDSVNDQCGLT